MLVLGVGDSDSSSRVCSGLLMAGGGGGAFRDFMRRLCNMTGANSVDVDGTGITLVTTLVLVDGCCIDTVGGGGDGAAIATTGTGTTIVVVDGPGNGSCGDDGPGDVVVVVITGITSSRDG